MARQIQQYRPTKPEEKVIFSDKIVVQLGIHALPGTEFKINGGNDTLIINATGNFSIDCEEHPIKSLELVSPISSTFPIIIDTIYEEVNS